MSLLGNLTVGIMGNMSGLSSSLKQSQTAVQQFSRNMKNVGRDITAIGRNMSFFVTGPAVLFAGAVTKIGADFEKSMTGSLAIMGDVSDDMRKQMENTAREVAKTTRFSADQAAESYFFLASAGLDAAASIEALPKVAAFAQAGNFDMARATDLLTDAQSALGLVTDDTAESMMNLDRVSNVLVKANTLANASVEEFSESLTEKAGAALRNLNKDVEEGVAVLAVFADQGIKGSRAGTVLNTTLEGLTRNARDNSEQFKELGVEVFDAEGNMNNMADIVRQLEEGMAGMSTEQREAVVAGLGFNRQARDGILALLGSSEALEDYENQLRDAGDITQEVADKQLQNFWDQLGLIKSQLADVAIELWQSLGPVIMDTVLPLVQQLSGYVERAADWFTNLSEAAQRNAIIGVALAAALGPVLVVVGMLVTLIGSLIPVFAGLLGPIGLAIAFFAALVAGGFKLYQNLETVKAVAENVFSAFEPLLNALRGSVQNLWDSINPIWESMKKLFESFLPILIAIGAVVAAVLVTGFGIAISVISAVVSAIGPLVNAVLNLLDVFVNVFKAIVALIRGDFDGAMGYFRNVADSSVAFVKNLFLAIWNFFSTFIKTIVGYFQSLYNILVGNSIIPDMVNAIVAWFRKLFDWLTGIGADILKAVRDMWNTALDFIKSIDLYSVGRDIILGMINGIKSMANAARKAVSDVANGVKNAVTGFFGISSPSKLMMEYGRDIGDGLKIGIERKVQEVGDAAGGMANQIASRVSTRSDLGQMVGSRGRERSPSASSSSGRSPISNVSRGDTNQTLIFNVPTASPSEIARKTLQVSRRLGLEGN